MKYEIIVLDCQYQLSDVTLEFVRKLQKFIELNYKDATIVKVSIAEEYKPLFNSDEVKIINV